MSARPGMMTKVSALCCAALLLVACGADESRLPVQEWQGITVGVETRPAPVVVGMNEFLISGTRLPRRVAHDLLVSIRMSDEDAWVQSIQDGHTGVYRRALKVGEGPQTLQVRLNRGAEETVLHYPLPPSAETPT